MVCVRGECIESLRCQVFGEAGVDFIVQVLKANVMQGVAGGDLPMVCPILECRYMFQIL